MKLINSSHLLILLGTDSLSVSSTRTSVVQTESDFLSPESVSAGANVVKNGPQYPDVFPEGKTASSLTDNEKISLLEGVWHSNDHYKFIFPLRFGKFIVL